ncbi:hypothetical protein D9M73_203600 [compost metagenome]
MAGRVADVALAGERLQVFDFGLMVARFEGDVRQGWASGSPIGKKPLLDAVGPGQGLEHTDLAGQFGQGDVEFRKSKRHGTSPL